MDYFATSLDMIGAVTKAEICNQYVGSDHTPCSLTIDLSKMKGGVSKGSEKMGDKKEIIEPKEKKEEKE